MAKHFRKSANDAPAAPRAVQQNSGGAATVGDAPSPAARRLELIKPLRTIRSTTLAAI